MKRHTFHTMGVAFGALLSVLYFLHIGSAGAGTIGPIIPKFDATCGGQTWTSVVQPSGGTAHLIAQGQSIHFEDDSKDYDASQVMDGQGGAVEDHIDTHTWWYRELSGQYGDPIGTASSLDWTPPASGKIYIIKKESDDQTPVVTEDAAAYCYMKFDVRNVDYVTVTPDPGYVAVGGGTLVLTGHAWDDSGTPDNTADDVELAATFNWTVDPALGTLAPASGKTSTLTAGANPGTCTVTATHQPSSKAGTAVVYVVKAEVKAVGFYSHNMLTDYNVDYGGDGGVNYDPDGWRKNPPKNNPITVSKGWRIVCETTLCVEPSGLSFDLIGSSGVSALCFAQDGIVSTGADQTVAPLSAQAELRCNPKVS